MTTKTYRGRSLEELLPKVRAELGPDAVIVRQREGLTGGVAGFFQRRLVEIEAAAPDEGGGVDVRDDSPATPDFLSHLAEAAAEAEAEATADETDFIPLDLAEPGHDDAWDDWRDPTPAPAPEIAPFIPDRPATPGPFLSELPEPPHPAPAARPLPAAPHAAAPHAAAPHASHAPHPAAPHPAAPRASAPHERKGAWHRNVDVPGTECERAWHRNVEVPGTGPAAAGTGPAGPAALPAPRPGSLRAPLPARAWPAEAAALRDQLVARGVEAPLAEEVVEETVTHLAPLRSGAKLRPLLVSALAQRIPVAPLGGLAGRVVAFVGPGGAGKTHCTGRLAAAYAAGGRMPVACVSLAPRDAGAELALLLAPAGVPLHTAATGAEAAPRVAELREHALVLVDTPAVSPRAKGGLRALHGQLRALGADDVLLTLPATTSAGAARELVAAGRRIGASAVVLTHADETEHLGPAVGVAMEAGLPFAYVGGQEALRPAAAEELAGALVGSSRAAAARR